MAERVGFIGVGRMGAPMVRRLLAHGYELTSEAMAVATKAGTAPDVALDILNVSSGRNSPPQDKFPKDVITGAFNYGFLLELMLKDVKLFEELADEMRVPTLVSPGVSNAWRVAVAQGYSQKDFTAIAQMFERWAGVEIRARRREG